MTVVRRLIVATYLLFLAAGVWFGLVAARKPEPPPRPTARLLAHVSAALVAERFRSDTLYAEARRADHATVEARLRQMVAEGRLSQEKARCGSW